MDAASYLKRHGWRGDGHSLDLTGRGISRPLLVSKKVDVLGVGLNRHAAVSDQWWMRAFDQGLKDLGTGKRTALADVREKGHLYGGLYGRFVKGDGVAGTFDTPTPEDSGGELPEAVFKKRKRGDDVGPKPLKKSSKTLKTTGDRNAPELEPKAAKQPAADETTLDKKAVREAKAAKKLAKREQRAERLNAAQIERAAVEKADKKKAKRTGATG